MAKQPGRSESRLAAPRDEGWKGQQAGDPEEVGVQDEVRGVTAGHAALRARPVLHPPGPHGPRPHGNVCGRVPVDQKCPVLGRGRSGALGRGRWLPLGHPPCPSRGRARTQPPRWPEAPAGHSRLTPPSTPSDLALRNCLLTADLTVKIGDYGLSQGKYREDYFVTADQLWVPLRWIAPELVDEVHGNLLVVDQTKASNVW
ncbi:Serine/threonine-protein kinase LMTK1 [Myotis brandtii]|uniref:Serine/threonine-protein kinase LMTK1 n=1 Tax=Myotis brandtii TaxID=109478 RepID=S7NGQ9_MYOBR|nr:Serine/threonine-protein kinase LMTK1 [Myotis brandtii]